MLMPPIEERLKTTLPAEQSERWGQDPIKVEVLSDHVHLLVGCDPQFGIHGLAKLLKGHISLLLRIAFLALKRRLPSLLTNN